MENKRNTNHNMVSSPEYSIWRNIKSKCLNHNEKSYHLYGGRGIKMCEKWLEFKGFFEDVGYRPAPGYIITLIDPKKDFSLENTQWKHWKENVKMNNRLLYSDKKKIVYPKTRDTKNFHKGHISVEDENLLKKFTEHCLIGWRPYFFFKKLMGGRKAYFHLYENDQEFRKIAIKFDTIMNTLSGESANLIINCNDSSLLLLHLIYSTNRLDRNT